MKSKFLAAALLLAGLVGIARADKTITITIPGVAAPVWVDSTGAVMGFAAVGPSWILHDAEGYVWTVSSPRTGAISSFVLNANDWSLGTVQYSSTNCTGEAYTILPSDCVPRTAIHLTGMPGFFSLPDAPPPPILSVVLLSKLDESGNCVSNNLTCGWDPNRACTLLSTLVPITPPVIANPPLHLEVR